MRKCTLLKNLSLCFITSLLFSCGGQEDGNMTSLESTIVGAGNESGTLSVAFEIDATTSTLKVNDDYPINITGTVESSKGTTLLTGNYDSFDDSIFLSGGNYAFMGTVVDSKFYGDYTNTTGSGIFSGFDSSSSKVVVYCGTYASNNCSDPDCSGIWNITTSSAGLSSGTYLGNGGSDGVLWGTFADNKLTGQDDEGSTFTGTVSNGAVSGTWELGGTTGTFEASITACN